MATIDQSTRRGRLITVFIGGLIIFGCVALAGLYLSNQRQKLFEASQGGESSQMTDLDDDSEEVADERNGDASDDEATGGSDSESGMTSDDEAVQGDDEESVDSVASTGPSSYDNEAPGEDEAVAGTTLPTTGPSDMQSEGVPAEIPATGPELWIVAIVGGLVAIYLTFEYRRSRLAFQRAALRRE